ncbi:hypothetical protein BK702_10405 [Bacillus thuringiensis serovar cameroun]|nr:hypothetical protein BK702_10405 [Bacillus thuringiensis serovar cameroun]
MKLNKGRKPAILGRGARGRLPVTVSIVLWMDLLGYGSMLREAKFDPTHPLAIDAIKRLEKFQSTVSAFSNRYMNLMCMNDGAISWRDLSYRDNSVSMDFMQRAIELHNHVNQIDKELGFYGARSVLAVGFRITNLEKNTNVQYEENILKRLSAGKLTPEQAVREAYASNPSYGFNHHLQGNFAFTKAYVVDSGGGKAGFGGPKMYIDLNLFDDELPEWIEFSREIELMSDGLNGKFGELKDFNQKLAGETRHKGILSATEISTSLFSDYNGEDPIKRLIKDRGIKKY